MSLLLIKKRPRFIQRDLLKWYQKAPYSQYDIFEVNTPMFMRWDKHHQVYTHMSNLLEICKKYPDSEIGVYERSEERIRCAILHKSYKEEFFKMYASNKLRKKLLLLC